MLASRAGGATGGQLFWVVVAMVAARSADGFEHHVAINHSQSATIIQEAFSKYLEWETYHHN